jgi:hypothetical protein
LHFVNRERPFSGAMGIERLIATAVLGLALLPGAAAAAAAPPEPLIVTRLADPDPNYVPPRGESAERSTMSAEDLEPTFDEAMQDFGRAIGQAALLQRQATEARCRSGAPAGGSASDRFAWEASCRYSRH